jgi:membrane protein DedA with SNARE-associated domain
VEVPFGIDALLVVLAARYGEIFWIFPPIVTAASLVGVGSIYWVGRSAGYAGLTRLVSPRHLARVRQYLDKTGAGIIAAAAVLPPPFPLTSFVLVCGALEVDRWRFFLVFGVMRFIRFGVVALLAHRYGGVVLNILESYEVQAAMVMIVLTATLVAAVAFWRRLPSIQTVRPS